MKARNQMGAMILAMFAAQGTPSRTTTVAEPFPGLGFARPVGNASEDIRRPLLQGRRGKGTRKKR